MYLSQIFTDCVFGGYTYMHMYTKSVRNNNTSRRWLFFSSRINISSVFCHVYVSNILDEWACSKEAYQDFGNVRLIWVARGFRTWIFRETSGHWFNRWALKYFRLVEIMPDDFHIAPKYLENIAETFYRHMAMLPKYFESYKIIVKILQQSCNFRSKYDVFNIFTILLNNTAINSSTILCNFFK